jgi:hypothetical protein
VAGLAHPQWRVPMMQPPTYGWRGCYYMTH